MTKETKTMCISKYIALHAKTQEEYIKHLEEYLLDQDRYERCEHCKRVELDVQTTAIRLGPDLIHVCDTCLPAWERAEAKAQEIAASDEKDYRAAKGRV